MVALLFESGPYFVSLQASSPVPHPIIEVRPVAHIRADGTMRMEQTMATGTVQWFNPPKGYGFIQPDGGTKDIFVHISAVERAGQTTLPEGQKLSFDVEQGQRGKESAVNLELR